MAEREKRTISSPVEVRAVDGRPTTLAGYAAVFNEETVIAGFFREVILPGAFTNAIAADDVRAQFNHGDGGALPLGRTSAGTLRLTEDDRGLHYEIDMPDTTQARDLLVSVKRGDVAESSFMFDVESSADETWDYAPTKNGQLPLRQIKRVKLYDVSPVVFPAYEGTSVSARAMVLKDAPPAVPPAPVPDPIAPLLLEQLALDEAAR